MESATPTKPRLHPTERRRLIEREALRLFGRDGYAATRLDDIASAAGVTKPVVYRHYASKKDLYLALLSRHEADLPTFVEGIELSANANLTEVIHPILEVWFDYIEENSDAWLIIFRDKTGDPEIERARRRVNDRATEVLAGLIRAVNPGLEPELAGPTADFLRGGLATLVLWWIDHPDVLRESVMRVATRACVATLRG